MRKNLAYLLLALCLMSPAVSFADQLTGAQIQIEHLTAIAAALQAQINATEGSSLSCGLAASNTLVKVNEPFFLAWGSLGALPPGSIPGTSMYSQDGVNLMTIDKAGTWTYSFTFYGKNGGMEICTQKIVVSA